MTYTCDLHDYIVEYLVGHFVTYITRESIKALCFNLIFTYYAHYVVLHEEQ